MANRLGFQCQSGRVPGKLVLWVTLSGTLGSVSQQVRVVRLVMFAGSLQYVG